MKCDVVAAAILALVVSSSVHGVQVIPVSYDMLNGSTGAYTYFDELYSGTGCSLCPGAALTGGTGDLTDGVTATGNWQVVEAPAGNGPYVGWADLNPTIAFHFGQTVAIDSVTFHFDDSQFGGVLAPTSVRVGSTTFAVIDPVGTAPFAFTVAGMAFIGSDLSVQINRNGSWVFASEISFQSAVPEASTPAMFLMGICFVIGALRLRRRATASIELGPLSAT